ncbi:MAG: hypothetical protein ACQSGP_21925 [Frankia sp.]
MTVIDVAVSPGSLTIVACDTVRTLLTQLGDDDRDGGPLARVLQLFAPFRDRDCVTCFRVTGPLAKLARRDVAPDRDDGSDRVGNGDAVADLTMLGYVECRDLLDEISTASYLDEGRCLTVVRVLRAFSVCTVHYHWTGCSRGPADQWEIVGRTGIVWPGTYLRGQVGDYYLRDVGVVYAGPLDLDTDPLAAAVHAATNVFTCHAVCDGCHADWYGKDGSSRFHADHASADFDFADGRRIHNNTIQCPEPLCVTGRVRFTIS